MTPSNYVVRNVRGTSGRTCACGSWLAHWFTETSSSRATCAVLGCSNEATVGAHVFEVTTVRGGNWKQFIVPMCHACNMSSADLEIDRRVALVSANTAAMGCYR